MTLQGLNLDLLLQHELTSMSLYLTKEENLRKSERSELLRELKHTLQEIPEAMPTDKSLDALISDFMAYCRKVPIKKLKLRTYEDLWSIFNNLSSNANRIDIVLDVYLVCIWKRASNSKK